MKKTFLIIIFIFLTSQIFAESNFSDVKFEIRTDTSVHLKSYQNILYLKNNSFVAIEDGKITDKFVTKEGIL